VRAIDLRGRKLPYGLMRHPRSRHVRITVRPDGIRVTAPPRYPLRDIEAFMRSRADWILAQVDRMAAAAPAPLADGAALPLLDGEVELGVRPGGRNRAAFRADVGRLCVELADPGRLSALVEGWYRGLAREHFDGLATRWAEALGVRYARLGVRDGRTRWASCSARGSLSFSWRLMMAPHRVGEYVVVHELAHLLEMNHSPAFWAVVSRAWPDWREDREWLRRNGPALERGPGSAERYASSPS
jgi:predicted metal-dependent hydrolase